MPNSPHFQNTNYDFRSDAGEQADQTGMRRELAAIEAAVDAAVAAVGCPADAVDVTQVVYSPKGGRFDVDVSVDPDACDARRLGRALESAAPGGTLEVPYGHDDSFQVGCEFIVKT